MTSEYVAGAKRIVAVGTSSAIGVRDDDQPAGVAHAVLRPTSGGRAVAACGADVIALPNRDWAQPTVGVMRCAPCGEIAG
ncbi:MAG: hypothetical protein ACXV3A_11110 [Kineosporiaceae bacterium]